jgi:hypothetical protein
VFFEVIKMSAVAYFSEILRVFWCVRFGSPGLPNHLDVGRHVSLRIIFDIVFYEFVFFNCRLTLPEVILAPVPSVPELILRGFLHFIHRYNPTINEFDVLDKIDSGVNKQTVILYGNDTIWDHQIIQKCR